LSSQKRYVLITAPWGWGDVATQTWAPFEANYFASLVIQLGYEPYVLAKDQDNTQQYNIAISQKPVMITGVGHGNSNVYTGYRLMILEQVPVAQGKYTDTIWCPVSCLVGNGLAQDIVAKGNNVVAIGEQVEYEFYIDFTDEHRGNDLNEDKYLASFLIPEFKFRTAILQGKTLKEAYDIMMQAYEEEARKWEKIEPDMSDTLRYDAMWRKRFGNDNWVIPQPPSPPQEKYACPYCDFSTDTKDKLAQHIKDKHQDIICKPCNECDYTCSICGYKAKDHVDLTMHVYNMHSKTETKYECPYCGKDFNSPSDLSRHICTEHLKPCHLSRILRDKLGCGIEKTCNA